ncbi:uncharacterized protein BT62DRAFT_632559 [Guyanagaster necrorhizus]|uniref:Secreted protein n=1 Tax=Guyanagaster necrorhizus TaxID=856835 RepID=A0A9P7VH29_9AGAR|nr:uncharacterized protein BT62DRAFT_632559 [Guyanagaster necrorhizus MCA 3950]KAG7440235.1 hypothetical protein BT62DRAFT_632559 [Guyanagaster necrorhizus MCA 3950]
MASAPSIRSLLGFLVIFSQCITLPSHHLLSSLQVNYISRIQSARSMTLFMRLEALFNHAIWEKGRMSHPDVFLCGLTTQILSCRAYLLHGFPYDVIARTLSIISI